MKVRVNLFRIFSGLSHQIFGKPGHSFSLKLPTVCTYYSLSAYGGMVIGVLEQYSSRLPVPFKASGLPVEKIGSVLPCDTQDHHSLGPQSSCVS